MTLVDKARQFAAAAHGAIGQKRKYTGENYIVHPAAVVAILREAGITDEETLCAAWLHDTIEDCPAVAACEIGAFFGPEIEALVVALTDTPAGKGLNRAARKALDRERLSKADPRAQTIKVADLIDNTSSIVQHDPDFAVRYMAEKRALLSVLANAHTGLWCRAAGIVADYFRPQVAA